MGLITEVIKLKWNHSNKKWFQSKGYLLTNINEEFEINVSSLKTGSHTHVEVQCDNKDCKKIISTEWRTYLKCMKNNKYYCHSCSLKLYGTENSRKARLKQSISFEQWCIDNDKKYILDFWDYKLNRCEPSEMGYGVNTKKFWFKCARGIHKSELKLLNSFTSSKSLITCNKCNSFAQWGIDNICEDFLEKYWDYKSNIRNPWYINKCEDTKKVWLKCQEKSYHGSYEITCCSFNLQKSRCNYCSGCNTHYLDSIGILYPNLISIWSDKNVESSYIYLPHSLKEVWWKCENNKHKDYKRTVASSNKCGFRCPSCQLSLGERKIIAYLLKNDISYIRSKKYKELRGIGKGLLSYDFYLPKYNLLIEYQGQFHDGDNGSGNDYIMKNLKKQQEHDKRKKQYAICNDINLLEIWYWDFEDTERILQKELGG